MTSSVLGIYMTNFPFPYMFDNATGARIVRMIIERGRNSSRPSGKQLEGEEVWRERTKERREYSTWGYWSLATTFAVVGTRIGLEFESGHKSKTKVWSAIVTWLFRSEEEFPIEAPANLPKDTFAFQNFEDMPDNYTRFSSELNQI